MRVFSFYRAGGNTSAVQCSNQLKGGNQAILEAENFRADKPKGGKKKLQKSGIDL